MDPGFSRTLASVLCTCLDPDNVYLAPLQPTDRNGLFRNYSPGARQILIQHGLTHCGRSSALKASPQWPTPMRGHHRQAAPTELSLPNCRGALPWTRARHRAQLKVRRSPTPRSLCEIASMHSYGRSLCILMALGASKANASLVSILDYDSHCPQRSAGGF